MLRMVVVALLSLVLWCSIGCTTPDIGPAPITPDEEEKAFGKQSQTQDNDVVPVDDARVLALIGQLGDDEFKVREAAEEELKGLGKSCLAMLDKHKNTDDPEVRVRIRRIIDQITGMYVWNKVSVSERMQIANLSKSAKELRQLAHDRDPNVRYRVARNRNTPAETLRQLARDADKDVRNQAMENLRERGLLQFIQRDKVAAACGPVFVYPAERVPQCPGESFGGISLEGLHQSQMFLSELAE